MQSRHLCEIAVRLKDNLLYSPLTVTDCLSTVSQVRYVILGPLVVVLPITIIIINITVVIVIVTVQAGGAGVVWQAYLKTRMVAAKQVYSQMLCESLTELSSEVKILASIEHRNILSFLGLCHYYDMKSEMSSIVLVTEWCPGTLRSWMEQSAWGTSVALVNTIVIFTTTSNVVVLCRY